MSIETISRDEVQRFLDAGAITIDTPLPPDLIQAAASVVDTRLPMMPVAEGAVGNYRYGETCSFFDPALVSIIEHPYFEASAALVLDAKLLASGREEQLGLPIGGVSIGTSLGSGTAGGAGDGIGTGVGPGPSAGLGDGSERDAGD